MTEPRSPGWPAVLRDGDVTLRPLRLRDAPAWAEARRRNVEWLREWEATPPGGRAFVPTSASTFITMTRRLRAEARRGRGLPFAILVEGEFAGQLNVGGIVRGSLHSGHLGYWIDERYAGRGVMPTAVALVTDHCFDRVDLHRVEVNIRPENAASRRVVEKLGFREEGLRRQFLHIAGGWRDHLSYVLLRGDVSDGLVARWHQRQLSRDTPLDVPDGEARRG
ncbi:MAG: [ribosomal protein S5]-alanine N-acetyltransferase [Frankiaceae bacterium]|nr:[ribosomal protein S5]-alanine N-acetyltransferase [Frankiaceae bacterium]